jgi:hypothetical protein
MTNMHSDARTTNMLSDTRMMLGLRAKVTLMAATAVFTLLVVAAWAVRAQEPTATPEMPAPAEQQTPPSQATVQASASQSAAAVYRQTVRVFVHTDSVRPRLIHLRPGPVTLRAENETGADVALIVERVTAGQPSHQVARVIASHDDKRGHGELALGVGEYVFYEESRPQLKGTLIVEPPGQ